MKVLVKDGQVSGLDRRIKYTPSSATRLIGAFREGPGIPSIVDGQLQQPIVLRVNDILKGSAYEGGCCPSDSVTGRRFPLLEVDAWEIPNTPDRTEVTLLKATYDKFIGGCLTNRRKVTRWVLVYFNNNRETRRAYANGADLHFIIPDKRKVKVIRETIV